MRETILVAESDGVAAVCQKLEAAEAQRIALVVPRRSALLRSEVDLAVIRRLADVHGLDLVLVTNDREGAARARAHGLRTAASTAEAQHVRAKASRGAVLSRPMQQAASAVRERVGRETQHGHSTSRPWQGAMVLVCGLILVIAIALGVALFVPSATVTLELGGDPAQVEMAVLASTAFQQIDYEQGAVPARMASIEVLGEEVGQTTGKESQPDQHATGEVVFVNKTSEPVTVAKGTAVRTTDGQTVRFYTLLDVDLPGTYGATVRVPVMAFEAGPVGNVAALTIRQVEGEMAYKVDVLNDAPTKGGSEKRIGIVSSQDYDRLRALLMQRLQREAYDLLVKELASDEWVPQDSLEVVIVDEVFDHKQGDQADLLKLTMKVRVSGLAVQGQAVKQLLARMLEVKRGEGRVVNEMTLRVEQPVGTPHYDGQMVRFTARANAVLVEPLDLQHLGRRIAGCTPKDAVQQLLRDYGLGKPPVIEVQPQWWPRLPWLADRIKVRLSGGS